MIPVVMLLFFKILETSVLVMINSTLFGSFFLWCNKFKVVILEEDDLGTWKGCGHCRASYSGAHYGAGHT